MEKLVFTCKTITPLVMNGAYDKIPELRPPGIKASLRFWWRALQGHLKLEELRKKEGEIFGNTKGRSKLIVRVSEMKTKSVDPGTALLPHKESDRDKSFVPAFVTNLSFKIRIDFDSTVISEAVVENLFVIACTLGGLGKRSRRGFGSIEVTEINGKTYNSPSNLTDIFNCVDTIVSEKYKLSGSCIEHTTINSTTSDEYPKLWKVEIGKSAKTLEDIGYATHKAKGANLREYSKSIGSGKPRFASPVYISILKNGYPIISTLKKQSKVDFTLQNDFKNEILI